MSSDWITQENWRPTSNDWINEESWRPTSYDWIVTLIRVQTLATELVNLYNWSTKMASNVRLTTELVNLIVVQRLWTEL